MASFNSMTKKPVNLVTVIDKIPYLADGVDGITSQVNAVLKANPRAQRLVLDVNRTYIHLEKLVPENEASPDLLGPSFYEIARNRPMSEYAGAPTKAAHEQLFEMFRMVEEDGLVLTHILVGSLSRAHSWIKFRSRRPTIFGVPVVHVPGLPEDIILFCGSSFAEGTPEDIERLVKGAIP